MAAIGEETKVGDLLEDLLRLEYDAVAAYEYAIDRLHSGELRAALGDFNEDHLRHVGELAVLIDALGRTPPEKGDAKRFLTVGKVALAGLVSDAAVLRAMRSNENATNAAYDQAVGVRSLSEDARRMLRRARDDERRHRDWIVAKLKEM